MCMVHGGAGFCLLADPIVSYISGREITDITVPVKDVQNEETRKLIDQVIINCNPINLLVILACV